MVVFCLTITKYKQYYSFYCMKLRHFYSISTGFEYVAKRKILFYLRFSPTGRNVWLHHCPPVCSWYTSITSSFSISSALGVSSSLIRLPSKRNRRDATGTPTRSLYDFFSLPICVVIFTLK